MGEEFASVAGTRLLVYRSFVWDLAICTWFYVFLFFFRSLSFLSLSPSSFTSLTMQWSKGGGREEKRGRVEKRGRRKGKWRTKSVVCSNNNMSSP